MICPLGNCAQWIGNIISILKKIKLTLKQICKVYSEVPSKRIENMPALAMLLCQINQLNSSFQSNKNRKQLSHPCHFHCLD